MFLPFAVAWIVLLWTSNDAVRSTEEKANLPSKTAVLGVLRSRPVSGPRVRQKVVHPLSTMMKPRVALVTKPGATAQGASTHPTSIGQTYRGGPSLWTTVTRIRSVATSTPVTKSSSSTTATSTTSTSSPTTSSSTAKTSTTTSASTSSTACPCARPRYYLCDPTSPCSASCCFGYLTCAPGSDAPVGSRCSSSRYAYSYCCI